MRGLQPSSFAVASIWMFASSVLLLIGVLIFSVSSPTCVDFATQPLIVPEVMLYKQLQNVDPVFRNDNFFYSFSK